MNADPSINNILPVPSLYGLVVCGGNSSRMGTDKSMLTYHNKPQRYHLYEMLQPFCEKVFISCNAKQVNDMEQGYNFLPDLHAYTNIGPMAALLTTFEQYPINDLLVIGCDYPFLTGNDLYSFLSCCNGETSAAFYNESEDIYEPLIAYYHYNAVKRLEEMYLKSQYSLQQFLKNEHATKFYPGNKKSIIGINTMADFVGTKELIM